MNKPTLPSRRTKARSGSVPAQTELPLFGNDLLITTETPEAGGDALARVGARKLNSHELLMTPGLGNSDEQIMRRIIERTPNYPNDGCWRVTGQHSKDGYGLIKITSEHRSQLRSIHAVAWRASHGQLWDGERLKNICGNNDCWRPDPGHWQKWEPADTFEQMVQLTPNYGGAGCWKIQCRTDKYGWPYLNNKRVHRIAWEHYFGPLPPSHLQNVAQICKDKTCWNPEHLKLGELWTPVSVGFPHERGLSAEAKYELRVVRPDDPDACYGWQGSKTCDKYGLFHHNRKPLSAHKFAWEQAFGTVPEGMEVCHSCDSRYPTGDVSYRQCSNIRHLYLDIHQANVQRSYDTERMAQPRGDKHWTHAKPELLFRGETHPCSKLTRDIVLSLRARACAGEQIKAMASEYPMVGYQAIFKAVTGITWRSLPTSTLPPKQARGALTTGARNTQAKLTPDQVLAIREEWDTNPVWATALRIAPLYSVGPSAIKKIGLRQRWAQIAVAPN